MINVILGDNLKIIDKSAFYHCDKLETVTFGRNLETINDYAFYYCYNLKNISIPNSLISINSNSFSECSRLEIVILGENLKIIGEYSFSYCTSLSNITIPSSVTSISSTAFLLCRNLQFIYVSSDNQMYSNYENDGILYNKNLTKVIIFPLLMNPKTARPNSVDSLGDYAFYGYDKEGEIYISKYVSIGAYAFSYCSNLESVVIEPNLKVIDSYTFACCTNLKEIKILNSVLSINDHAFYDCTNLEIVILGENIETISDYAFSYCTSLNNITIPASVTSISSLAFVSCRNLQVINVSLDNQMYSNYENDGILYDKDIKTILIYPSGLSNIGASIPGPLRSIGDYAFCYCYFTFINIRVKIISIGAYALCHCYHLETVKFDANIKAINTFVFAYCTNLRNIEIPNSVISINDHAFYECYYLESVTLSENLETIGDYAFCSCSYMNNITIPASVTSISSNAFVSCISLQIINVSSDNLKYSNHENDGILYDKDISTIIVYPEGHPNSIYLIPKSVTTIGKYIFAGHSYLSSIVVNNVEIIDDYSFYNCYFLNNVILGEKLKTIGDHAFSDCNNLNNITIPSSVTSISSTSFLLCLNLQIIKVSNDNQIYSNYENDGILYDKNISTIIIYPNGITNETFRIPNSVISIGNYSFSFNQNLFEVIIGNNVNSIGSFAFSYCYSIQHIFIPNSVITIGKYAFYSPYYYQQAPVKASYTIQLSNSYISMLNTIIIGENVKLIEEGAFLDCYNLDCIYFYGVVEPNIAENAFSNVYLSKVMTLDTYIDGKFGGFSISRGTTIEECHPFIFLSTNTYSQSNTFTSSYQYNVTMTHSFILTYTISLSQTVTLYNSFISNTISNSNGIFTHTKQIFYEYKVIIFSKYISFYSDFFTIFYQYDYEQTNDNKNDIIIGVCVAIAIVVIVAIVIVTLILVRKKKRNIEESVVLSEERNDETTNIFTTGKITENIKEDPFADDFKEDNSFVNI